MTEATFNDDSCVITGAAIIFKNKYRDSGEDRVSETRYELPGPVTWERIKMLSVPIGAVVEVRYEEGLPL